MNDSSLWLLTRCGYWLVVVIGLLWLLTCYVLNDKSKKISVSHAKHWQIREIRVRNKYIRAIRSSCERTAANKDLRSVCLKIFVLFALLPPCGPWAFGESRVQNDEWFKMMSGSFVVSGFM